MSEPADKSDDLIAELAKLMAVPQGNAKTAPALQPVPRPAPIEPQASAPAQQGIPQIRIPGMDAPAPRPVMPPIQQAAPAPASSVSQREAQRAPMTGSIRIPGMDQPAPVATSAPVGKFDFGGKPAVAPIKPEPLASLTERLAAGQASVAAEASPAPATASTRIPSDLKPVSENRSFGEGPSLAVTRPAPQPAPIAPAVAGSAFNFDFGFNNAAPVTPPAMVPIDSVKPAPGEDPIAALIEADMAEDALAAETEALDERDQEEPAPDFARPQMATVTPINRITGSPGRPTMAQVGFAPQRTTAGNSPIPLKPVSVAPRPPESDRFAISPGVGLNMRPPASQPLSPQPAARAPAPQLDDESDPMLEIENLIGEAVRVELSPGPVRVQTPQMISPSVEFEPEADVEAEIRHRSEPAPVVPPLTTQFAPRRSNIKEEAGNNSAEAAILAAAAASGATVGRVEPAVGDESPYRRLKVKPQKARGLSGGVRQYVGMAVAGTLLLAAGLGLYWVLNMGRVSSTTGANAPQLTADATPVKVKPAPVVKTDTDSAKSPVLAKMDGAPSAPSSEQLVSTDQSATTNVTRDVTAVADPDGENGLANRKVRTVTVRPDGTIVPGDDALAGGAQLAVDRPNVPDVPSAEQPVNLLGTDSTVAMSTANPSAPLALAEPNTTAPAAAALTSPTAAEATSQIADVPRVMDPTAVAPKPMTFPVKAGGANPAPLAPTTQARNPVTAVISGAQTPNGQIDLLGGGNTTSKPQQVAVAKPTTTASAPAGSAAAYVQLSSQPTQADAQNSMKAATAKYGALFGGSKLTIQQADLGQKGVRYRVRLPASSLSEANSICAQIKAQGGDCFATNG